MFLYLKRLLQCLGYRDFGTFAYFITSLGTDSAVDTFKLQNYKYYNKSYLQSHLSSNKEETVSR